MLDDAPFKLRPAPGKGWGAFATRKLAPGQLIIEDKPLLVIPKSHKHITESDVMSRFQRLPPRDKHRFLSLRNNGDREFTSMKKAFTENAFGVSNTHHVHGLFVFLSRFNHACVPNCKVPMAGTVIQTNRLHIYATRTVMPSEKLTFCYNSIYDYMIAKDRTQRLGFQCDCKACLIGTPFQRASNMRRTLLRGLYFLKEGEDINWPRPVSMPPVLSDPQVRRAAEGFTLPLSTRFIASTMRAFLLEEEGLMDQFIIELLGLSDKELVVASFKTASNAQVAAVVMAQKSWLGKLCAVFKLLGKKDGADREVAAVLQKQ